MALGVAVHPVRNQRLNQGAVTLRENTARKACRIRQAFDNSSFAQLRKVRIEVHPEGLCLRGEVPCYFLKQIAQVLASRHADDQTVQNEITVGLQQQK